MHGAVFSSVGWTRPTMIPPESELKKAAEILNAGKKVAILVGQGAAEASDEVVQVAELLGAGDRLSDGPLMFCVFNNQDLNQMTWEQRAMGGERKFQGSQYIPDVPYAEFANLLGLTGIRCDSPKTIAEAWEQALSANRPVVLEVVVDADIPPVPPHTKKEMAKKTAKAVIKDPDRVSIATKGAKQKMHEFTESLKPSSRKSGE
jgi:pyruvate dehydrogenase (quinone)